MHGGLKRALAPPRGLNNYERGLNRDDVNSGDVLNTKHSPIIIGICACTLKGKRGKQLMMYCQNSVPALPICPELDNIYILSAS